MKIAYVTTYDASNRHAWSGTGFSIHHELSRQGIEVELIGSLRQRHNRLTSLSNRLWKRLGYQYLNDRDPILLKGYAREVENRLRGTRADLILSPGTIPIAYLKTDIPIVFWTDATFGGLLDYYDTFSNLSFVSVMHGHRMEKRAIRNASLAVYSSDWAARTAVEIYGADRRKIRVIPFGSNLNGVPELWEVEESFGSRPAETCRLLFAGVKWNRKGGPKAVDVARALERMGTKVSLEIVGVRHEIPDLPEFAVQHGFLRKDDSAQNERLMRLFRESHFLLLPTQADCVPVVFAEANSYGLPVVTHDTGGIASYIADGVNGLLFSESSAAEEMAGKIGGLFSDTAAYRSLCMASYRHVIQNGSWARSVGLLLEELQRLLRQ
jgi:glycosyltransferase involved in cell wall biosynthesis